MRFAAKHPSKQLILAEFGTPEGLNEQKAEWFDEARKLFKSGEYRDRFAALLYFHHDDAPNGNPSCDWWLDSSTSSLNAARRFAQDSFYQAPIGELGMPTPEPPATVGCSATRVGDSVTLSWSDNGQRPVLRRNGKWLISLTSGTTTHVDRNAPAGANHVVRTNGQLTHTCTNVGGSAGCTVSRSGTTVTLRWSDDGGRHVIRRNGSWLRTVGSGVDSFVDRNAPLGANYVVKTRTGDSTTDRTCR